MGRCCREALQNHFSPANESRVAVSLQRKRLTKWMKKDIGCQRSSALFKNISDHVDYSVLSEGENGQSPNSQ